MPDERAKKTEPKGGSGAGAEQHTIERRASSRKPFRAAALIVELESGNRLKTQTSELAAQGCFIDTLNPFPVGMLVRVQLEKGKQTLESNARVVYQLPGFGMGVVFLELRPEQETMLQAWLEDMPEADVPVLDRPEAAGERRAGELAKRDALSMLIKLLMNKHVLTYEEGSELLRVFRQPPA